MFAAQKLKLMVEKVVASGRYRKSRSVGFFPAD
jgi:hypothetical protein